MTRCEHPPLPTETLGDSALVKHLSRAKLQAASAKAGKLLTGTPLNNRDIDLRQRQLACQHQPGRTGPNDYNCMMIPPLAPAMIKQTHFVPPTPLV